MSYRTIMVALALEQSNDARLRVAADLAERFGASVIGIAACDHTPPPYYMSGAIARDIVAQDLANLKARLGEVEQRFRNDLQGRAKALEWRSSLTRPTDYVAHQARAADLVIAGVHSEGTVLDPFRHVDVSTLLMQAGRPVLVVPDEIEWVSFKTALIGWKDTREARRAVMDALPLLKKVQEVHVAEIPEGDSAAVVKQRVEDVVGFLKSHEINAFSRVVEPGGSAPQALEAVAAGVGCDLIVAGAYGHTRFSEWVFGGVTRNLLAGGARCALLSH